MTSHDKPIIDALREHRLVRDNRKYPCSADSTLKDYAEHMHFSG